jgi:hypothetical protein
MWDTRKTRTYRVLLGGNIPLERLRPRWEDNIKTDLNKIGWESWIPLGTDKDKRLALVKAVMKFWVP